MSGRSAPTSAQSTKPAASDFKACNSNADVPPQAIYDLAAALKNDPTTIFHFVHDNIDLEPGVESAKGALGTYLDRSGSSFDQAALLLALLQAASASNSNLSSMEVVVGVEPVTAAQFGLTSLPTQLLKDAGDDASWAASSTMPYAWVQLKVNGSWVVMDPAAKTYTVLAGTTQPLHQYDNGLQADTTAAVNTALSGFSHNLYGSNTWTNSAQGDYTLPLFIGGRRIVVSPTSANTNPNNLPVATAQGAAGGSQPSHATPSWYSGMPYYFRSVFRMQLQGGDTGQVCLDQVYGHSDLIYDTNFVVDNVTIYAGNGSSATSTDLFQLWHQTWSSAPGTTQPATWQQSANESVTALNGAALQFSVGRVGAYRAQEMAKVAEAADMPGGGLSEKDFASLGAGELRQTSRGTEMLDQLAGTYTINHHTVQFEHYTATSQSLSTIGTASLAGVDTPLLSTSVDVVNTAPASGLSVSPSAVAYALGALQSAQEAAALNHANVPASVSAATLMANSAGSVSNVTVIPRGTQNVGGFGSIGQNYSAGYVSTLQAYSTAGFDLTVPKTAPSWGSGATALAFYASASAGNAAFVLQTPNGVYKGASSPNAMLPGGGTVGLGDAQPESGPRGTGLAVDAGSGQVSFAQPVLSVGGQGSPYTLGLNVMYSSDASQQATLGTGNAPGWSTNYNISLALTSDPSAMIGSDLVAPAIPGIVTLDYLLQHANEVATYYAQGTTGSYPLGNAAFDMAADAAWYLQQATNDVAVIARGTARETFVRMPDGSYQTPAPSADTLQQSGGNWVYYDPSHNTQTFPGAGGAITAAQTVYGVSTNFAYQSYGSASLLSKVSTSSHTLNWTYAADPNAAGKYLLQQVADETGRLVGLNYGKIVNQTNTLSILSSINLVDNTAQNPRALNFGYTSVTTGDFWPAVASGIWLTSVTDPLTYKASTYPDSRDFAVSLTNANGHTTSYYSAGNRTEVDDALGNASYSVTYPAIFYGDWIVTDSYDPLGNKTTSLSNYVGEMQWVNTPLAQTTAATKDFTYDAKGHVTSTTLQAPGSNGAKIYSTVQWDPTWNKPAIVTDQNGNPTYYYYDANYGYLSKVVQPGVPCGNCGGNGNQQPTTQYVYASDGQVFTVQAPDGEKTCYTYDAGGDLASVVTDCSYGQGGTHLNLTTTLNYDETPPGGSAPPQIGNVTSIVTPAGHRYAAAYDLARRMVTKTNPPTPWLAGAPSLSTTYTYDADGRLTQSSYDTGTKGGVNRIEVLQVATQTYDDIGHLLTKTIPNTNGGTLHTQYYYDQDERLSQTTDPAANTTIQTYDADSRAYQSFAPGESAAAKTILYNADGLTYQVKDGAGNATTYGYDAFDRLTSTSYLDNTSETLTLDNDGGVTKRVDRAGNTFAYTLDALERETSETDTSWEQGQSTYTKSLSYDAASRVIGLGGSGGSFTYGYDTAGRQIQTVYAGLPATGNNGYTTSYTYDADNNTRTITYPDGYLIDYNYDALEEMLGIRETTPGSNPTTTLLVSYTYNTLGALTQAAFSNGATTTYTGYDPYNALTGLQFTAANKSLTIGYARDQDERRSSDSYSDSSYVWHPPAAASVPYTANSLNQYATINGQQLGYARNGVVGADPTGPLGSAGYGWDMFNRLDYVTNSQHVANYTYDLKGNRSRKVVDNVGENFAYDGDRPLVEYGDAALPASAQVHWVYGVGNAPAMMEYLSNNNRVFLHKDALGTLVATSDNTGNLTGGAAYPTSPWGETPRAVGVPFRFAGMWLDSESMLYYDHARYYSPAMGRFLSPDPSGILGGINIYAYTNSEPVNNLDINGLGDSSDECDGFCQTATFIYAGVENFGGAWQAAHTFYTYNYGNGNTYTVSGLGQLIGVTGNVIISQPLDGSGGIIPNPGPADINFPSLVDTIVVGGFFDQTIHGPAWQATHDDYGNPLPNTSYFTWDQLGAIEQAIEFNPNADLYGHSYGGDTAAAAVAYGYTPASLTTIDPVSLFGVGSWFGPSFSQVAQNVDVWTNYIAAGGSGTWPNFVAGVGGAWDNSSTPYATQTISVPFGHQGAGFYVLGKTR